MLWGICLRWRAGNAFSLDESCSILSFLLGNSERAENLHGYDRFSVWYCANGLAVVAEKCVRRESHSLPEGISHHAAHLLIQMFLTFFRNGDVKQAVLMFDQTPTDVNDGVPVKINWNFIYEKQGRLFSSLAVTFVSALSCYSEDDARVYDKTVQLLRDEILNDIGIDWSGRAAQIVADMTLAKVRSRFLRSLRRFILQMIEHSAEHCTREVVEEWTSAAHALDELRQIRVTPQNDHVIRLHVHETCDLINEALTQVYISHVCEPKAPHTLPPPAEPAPEGEVKPALSIQPEPTPPPVPGKIIGRGHTRLSSLNSSPDQGTGREGRRFKVVNNEYLFGSGDSCRLTAEKQVLYMDDLLKKDMANSQPEQPIVPLYQNPKSFFKGKKAEWFSRHVKPYRDEHNKCNGMVIFSLNGFPPDP